MWRSHKMLREQRLRWIDWLSRLRWANRRRVKIRSQPLTEQETLELCGLLEASGGASLEFARGVFGAAITAPTRRDVADWLPWIVGDKLPDQVELKRLVALVMRDFHACEECFALGVPVVPAASDEEAVRAFCKGYVRVAHEDARWKADMEAFALTVPFAVLSGYIAAESLTALQPELAADPAAWCTKQRHDLQDSTARLYAYWAPMRSAAPSQLIASGKVGRNELCPCLSGKKYKKCCGVS